ncbi:uncharacterized protein DNG_04158 [Cephalotrichum gorgonifer]|uniref:Uncharacterized protein n=1 Tax=Cephalotrichum gorgonifer TaxID=2041049 RepID=A0AAE8SUA6_9PEZI|nr:uncharacterized protein DNG_04158 [Cephalotrichum gorgonifer]
MQASKTSTSSRQGSLRFALESYAHSITSLRTAMSAEQDVAVPRANVLWTTFFLGLFELMQDSSGHGWLQHMIYGTSRALIASGPSACTSGSTRTFFAQARTFEVCRAIIFNEPTFLAQPEWMDVTSPPLDSSILSERTQGLAIPYPHGSSPPRVSGFATP